MKFLKMNIKYIYFLFITIFFPFTVFSAQSDLIWSINKSGTYIQARDLAVNNTGIYVVGLNKQSSWTFVRARVEKRSLTDGSLIWEKDMDLGGNAILNAIEVDSTALYMVGCQNNYSDWRVEKRSLTDGSLVWEKVINMSGGQDFASHVTIDTSGIYIAGYINGAGVNMRWRVEKRSLTDGSLIWEKEIDLVGEWETPTDITSDLTGIYISGWRGGGGIDQHGRIEKRNPTNGNLIWEKTMNICAGCGDSLSTATAHSTGLYLGGDTAQVGNPDNRRWRVEKRSLTDGSLIWERVEDFSSKWDTPYNSSVDSGGLYLAGPQNKYQFWRVEKRSLTDGSLIWERVEDFTPPGGGFQEIPYGIKIFMDKLYISGQIDTSGIWRVEKRGDPCTDIGLRFKTASGVVKIDGQLPGSVTSPLRIGKNGSVYGVLLVNPGDSADSGMRIKTNSGVKALKKCP